MAYSVDWTTRIISIPQTDLIFISTGIYKLDLEECHQELRRLEWEFNEGMSQVDILEYIPPLEAGGVIYARFVLLINGYTVTFEDGQYAVNFDGANTNIHDYTNVNQVSIRPNNSAGLQDLSTLLSSAYNGEVVIDVINGQDGTSTPIGTRSKPVKIISDARIIMSKQNVPTLALLGNITIGLGDDVAGIRLKGESHVHNTLIIEDASLCDKTQFISLDISGVLDSDSEIRDCVVGNLDYFDGHIHNSLLNGIVTLSGTNNALIDNCKALDVGNPAILDCNNSLQNLSMPNWSGPLTIINCTEDVTIGVGVDAGEVIIDSSCTGGLIALAGNGTIEDNSGIGCYVVDNLSSGTDIQNIKRLIEYLRPHHTGSGLMWFWNPYNGDDTWDGRHKDRAFKTFAKAHDSARNAGHDIIVCVSGNPNGLTISNEVITISKDYLFLRGPGRDFNIINIDDTKDAITITGRGAEVSGLRVATTATSIKRAIYSTGDFTLVKNVYIYDSNDGIEFKDNEYSIVDDVKSHHNAGFGIKVSGTAEHVDLLNNHIGGNGGSGIVIDTNAGHEVNIKNNVIHKNSGYGIEISATSDGVLIDARTEVFGNTLGDIEDNGISTHIGNIATKQDVNNAIIALA